MGGAGRARQTGGKRGRIWLTALPAAFSFAAPENRDGPTGPMGTMLELTLLALFLIFVSVAMHSVVVAQLMVRLISTAHLLVFNVFRTHALLLFLVFIALLASHLAQAALWAGAYYLIGGFDDMPTSLYFSLSSYTTVGFADVVLPERFRLLGPLEAATGVLMFGWSTGYIFAFATRMLSANAEATIKRATEKRAKRALV
jgi:hypothetical protein